MQRITEYTKVLDEAKAEFQEQLEKLEKEETPEERRARIQKLTEKKSFEAEDILKKDSLEKLLTEDDKLFLKSIDLNPKSLSMESFEREINDYLHFSGSRPEGRICNIIQVFQKTPPDKFPETDLEWSRWKSEYFKFIDSCVAFWVDFKEYLQKKQKNHKTLQYQVAYKKKLGDVVGLKDLSGQERIDKVQSIIRQTKCSQKFAQALEVTLADVYEVYLKILKIRHMFEWQCSTSAVKVEKKEKSKIKKVAVDDIDLEKISNLAKKGMAEVEDTPEEQSLKDYSDQGDFAINAPRRFSNRLSPDDTIVRQEGCLAPREYGRGVANFRRMVKMFDRSASDENLKENAHELKYVYRGLGFDIFLKLSIPDKISEVKEKIAKAGHDCEKISGILDENLAGVIISDRAPLSTSTNMDTAEGFAMDNRDGGVCMTINAENCKKYLNMKPFSYYPEEEEILLPPNTQLKITSVDKVEKFLLGGENC